MLIDYEYGNWNPRAYDIANFFNEFCFDNVAVGEFNCGMQYYENNFPSQAEREIFAREYLINCCRHEEPKATEEETVQYCKENLETLMREIE